MIHTIIALFRDKNLHFHNFWLEDFFYGFLLDTKKQN